MIMKYINMDFSEHDFKLGKIVDSNENYMKALNNLKVALKKLDRKTELDIDEKVVHMEALAKDICYDTGFQDGAKFAIELLTGKVVEKGVDQVCFK